MAKVIKPGKGTTRGFANFPTLSFGAPAGAGTSNPPAAPATPYDRFVTPAFFGIQTPAQIAAQARTQAVADEKGRLAAIKAIEEQTVAAYGNQQTRAEGFAGALQRLQAGEGKEAFDRYGQAAERLTGLGSGLTGAVGEGYQSAVDRTREAIAKLTGGRGEVTATSGADIANASLYSGATAPGHTLQENAVAAGRLAASDAAARTEGIHQIGLGYGAKIDDAIAQSGSDQRAEVAKRPATIAALVNQLTTNRQTGVSNLMSTLNNRETWRQNKVTADAAAAAVIESRRRWEAENTRADLTSQGQLDFLNDTQTPATRAELASKLSAQRGMLVDWQGKPVLQNGKPVPMPGFKIVNGQAVVDPTAKAGTGIGTGGRGIAAYGGLTPEQWDSKVTKATDDLEKWTTPVNAERQWVPLQRENGVNVEGTGRFVPVPGTGKPALTYQEALRKLAGRGSSKAWKAQALQLVNNEYDEGEGGRPYETLESATAAAQQEAQAAFQAGMPYRKAIANARKVNAVLPFPIFKKWIDRVYGLKTDPSSPDRTESTPMPSVAEPGELWNKTRDKAVGAVLNLDAVGRVQRTQSGRWVDVETGRYIEKPGG